MLRQSIRIVTVWLYTLPVKHTELTVATCTLVTITKSFQLHVVCALLRLFLAVISIENSSMLNINI